ncbi:cyclic nucleotide-binding domain-containing protein [Polyangium sp. y55x31]|uniref:cyclic nucleotide-binding domain-containing protein n=1 Tax=Polyangium sp. y55x31 TaxID=3042688 RepID=UPI002482AA4D|nr:cyclic nucleotide-binding domain-containing protein [Polyangium sp. y55x31]MDI1480500.1 cyclic nucleotide-binding domain-containing protein [Polyangium sp. y55x31]
MSVKLGFQGSERLREIGLFGGLGDEVLQDLSGSLDLIELTPGSVVFREGDSGREMFVLLDGEMEVLKQSKRKHETRVAVLGPGDWFGEMSILDVLPRSATVRAVAPSRLLRITAHDLDSLYRRDLRAYSLLVLNIAREMSRRLRVCDNLLAELVANVIDEYTRPNRTS